MPYKCKSDKQPDSLVLSSHIEKEIQFSVITSLTNEDWYQAHKILAEQREISSDRWCQRYYGKSLDQLHGYFFGRKKAGLGNTQLNLKHPQYRGFMAKALGESNVKDNPVNDPELQEYNHVKPGLFCKGVDYLRVVREKSMTIAEFESLLKYLLVDPTSMAFAPLNHKHSFKGTSEKYDFRGFYLGCVNILWNCGRNQEGEIDLSTITKIWVELSGTYFYNVLLHNQLRFLQGMYFAFDFRRCTRIDLAVDDFQKIINSNSFLYLKKQVVMKNVTGIQKGKIVDSFDTDGNESATLYLGSTKSNQYLRIYETKVKHGYDAMRVEAEYKLCKAQQAYEILVALKREGFDEDNHQLSMKVAKVIGGLIMGVCRFIHRDQVGSNGCVKNAPTLEYWKLILERWKCADYILKLKSSRKEPSWERKLAWLDRQVVPSIEMLRQVLGSSRTWNWLRERMSKKDLSYCSQHLVDFAKANPDFEIPSDWIELEEYD